MIWKRIFFIPKQNIQFVIKIDNFNCETYDIIFTNIDNNVIEFCLIPSFKTVNIQFPAYNYWFNFDSNTICFTLNGFRSIIPIHS